MKVKLESLVTTHPTIVSSSVKDTFTEVLFEIYVDKVVEIVFVFPNQNTIVNIPVYTIDARVISNKY